MKLQKLIPVGILLLLSVATLSAQNTLPNPHDDACWSSLSALRACQLQAYDKAMDQAQRCTSYPEYQCLPRRPAATEDVGKTSGQDRSENRHNDAQNAVAASAPVAPDTQPAGKRHEVSENRLTDAS